MFLTIFVNYYYENFLQDKAEEEITHIPVIEKIIYQELRTLVNTLQNKSNALSKTQNKSELSYDVKNIYNELNYSYGGIKSLKVLKQHGNGYIGFFDDKWLPSDSYYTDLGNTKNLPRYLNKNLVISPIKQYKNTVYISLYLPVNQLDKGSYLAVDIDITKSLQKALQSSSDRQYLLLNSQFSLINFQQEKDIIARKKMNYFIDTFKSDFKKSYILDINNYSLTMVVYNRIHSFDSGIISVINFNNVLYDLILDTIMPVFLFIIFYMVVGIIIMERIFNVPGALSQRWKSMTLMVSTFFSLLTNIRYLKLQIQQYSNSHEQFLTNYNNFFNGAIVYENTSDGIVITDEKHKIISVNESFTSITGYSKSEVIGKSPSILKSGRHNKFFYKSLWDSVKRSGRWQGEVWNKRKNGEIYPELLTINTIKDKTGKITHHMGVFSDISSVPIKDEHLEHLAFHDPLTNLPNRLKLKERLSQEFICANNNDKKLAVLFIDLDGFKEVNDRFGHDFGDKLLILVASRLKNSKRKNDFLARLGGDEFVLTVNSIEEDESIHHIAENIIQNMREPFHVEMEKLNITASIGISIYPTFANDVKTILKQADTAMYKAKSQGRNNYVFYDH